MPTRPSAKMPSQKSATRIEASPVMSTIQPSPSGRNHTAPDCMTQPMGWEPSEGSRLMSFLPASETMPAVSRNSSQVEGKVRPSSSSSTSRL